MKKILSILKSKRGISELVSAIAGLIAIVIAILISICALALAHTYSVVDDFASEMIDNAKTYGVVSGNQITRRYDSLVASLGIAPTYEFTDEDGDRFSKEKVQEGEVINLTIHYNTFLYGPKVFGKETKIPVPITVNKTKVSTQYWKELMGDYYVDD